MAKWYVLTFKPLPNQNVSGSFQLRCRANSVSGAASVGESQCKDLNEMYVKDKRNKPVKNIQWQLTDVSLDEDQGNG